MSILFPTVVWRHRKENKKKCSLRGLESREDFLFFEYPGILNIKFDDYILLDIDGEELSPEDNNRGILLLDGTWKYVEKMKKALPSIKKRRIPNNYITSYPRKQTSCSDPNRGLASIEAIYIAYNILNRDTSNLLDLYHWKEEFIENNFK